MNFYESMNIDTFHIYIHSETVLSLLDCEIGQRELPSSSFADIDGTPSRQPLNKPNQPRPDINNSGFHRKREKR